MKWPTVGNRLSHIGSGVVKFSEDGAMWQSLVDIGIYLPQTYRKLLTFSIWKPKMNHFNCFSKTFTPKDCPNWVELLPSGLEQPFRLGFVPKNISHQVGEVRLSITMILTKTWTGFSTPVAANEAEQIWVVWRDNTAHTDRSYFWGGRRWIKQKGGKYGKFRCRPKHAPSTNWGVRR